MAKPKPAAAQDDIKETETETETETLTETEAKQKGGGRKGSAKKAAPKAKTQPRAADKTKKEAADSSVCRFSFLVLVVGR